MLDQESLNTYKSITLPRDLRADILVRHENRQSLLTRIASQKILRPAAALCSLVLIATLLSTAALHSQRGVYADGKKISTEPRVIATESVQFLGGVMRVSFFDIPKEDGLKQTATECIPLQMRYGRDVCITIQEGSLILTDDSGNSIFADQTTEVKNGATAYWSVETCKDASPLIAYITDQSGNAIDTITLTYDATDGIWLIANTMSDH